MAVKASKHFDASAIVHPAFIQDSDANDISTPFCLIDSSDEPKDVMDSFITKVEGKVGKDNVFRNRYDTFHGFCAGRANYQDEKNAKDANDVPLFLSGC